MADKMIRVRLSGTDHDTAYLKLPRHTGLPGSVRNTVRIEELIPDYRGPYIAIDFDADGVAVGIEVLVLERDK